ncbi:aspartyl protease family protein (plasmid) [Bacillus licheniformis]|nr:aspartyl protease family protein [Bacillus licheniformis]
MEAECIFAFMGQSEWPDNYVTSVNATENEKERSRILGGGVGERVECADADEGTSEGSLGLVSSAARDEPKGHSKMMKLNPGERQGWWSAKKFDRRIRMRALVQGAVNDQRTRILLDTGANVSVITDAFAKKLRLRDVP